MIYINVCIISIENNFQRERDCRVVFTLFLGLLYFWMDKYTLYLYKKKLHWDERLQISTSIKGKL